MIDNEAAIVPKKILLILLKLKTNPTHWIVLGQSNDIKPELKPGDSSSCAVHPLDEYAPERTQNGQGKLYNYFFIMNKGTAMFPKKKRKNGVFQD